MSLHHRNKGISYVEVILVLTLMILLTTFVTVTMSVINRNSVTKGADKVTSAISHSKTLSLSKGSKKGSITFGANGNKIYYYYGDNADVKNYVCNSPCTMSVTINDIPYNINGNTRVKFKFSSSTGAFNGVDLSLDNGSTFTSIITSTGDFSGTNRISIDNHGGNIANIDLNIHVGTVKVSY